MLPPFLGSEVGGEADGSELGVGSLVLAVVGLYEKILLPLYYVDLFDFPEYE